MLGLMIAIFITGIAARMILKHYKPQMVLIVAGFLMMACAVAWNFGPIMPVKQSTGFNWFDIFHFADKLLSTRTADLGMIIMISAGFASYMDKIGASNVFVHLATQPLKLIRSRYVVLSLGFFICQFLHIFVPTAAGYLMLLMVTVYPIYVGLGISRLTATAVIATNASLDVTPVGGNTILAAKLSGITPVEYFANNQMTVLIITSIIMAVIHFFIHRRFEAEYREKEMPAEAAIKEKALAVSDTGALAPLYYAILPTVPLILVMAFGYFKIKGINLGITAAMFISISLAMACEVLRYRDLNRAFSSIQVVFDAMGKSFSNVITLIVSGEIFAKGLQSLGAIDTLIDCAQNAGVGKTGMTLIMSGIIAVCTLVMGSGNASFFSLAAFAPDIAKEMGTSAVSILLPMHMTASIARQFSPITASVVAICGVAGVSPFAVVRRTIIPLIPALIIVQIITYFMYN
ncbi:MAG: C4-dicarboxylate transporter DcuC [Veillonellales bacterium]